MNIIEQRTLNGILEDEKNLTRSVASAVATLTAQINLMVELAPYLFDSAADPSSQIDAAYMLEVTNKFNVEIGKLEALLPTLQALHDLNSTDTTTASNARAAIDAMNVGKPPFPDRYK